MTNSLPKWSTPERQAYLVKLWSMYGNKCLLGHNACPVKEHYYHVNRKLVKAQIGQPVKCLDIQGLPVTDNNGNQLYITVYELKKTVESKIQELRLYDLKSEDMIQYWIAEDRDRDRYEWELELNNLHHTSDRKFPLRGRFSAVSRDVWHDSQPLYYLEALGISALTFKPFARLRIASSGYRLYVDISDVLKPLSKNARRKAIRYSKSSLAIENSVKRVCYEAVKAFI